MIHVSTNSEFANFGPLKMDTAVNADLTSVSSCGRVRSSSLHSDGDSELSAEKTETGHSYVRPRSRSFYSFETAAEDGEGNFTRSDATRPRSRSLLQNEPVKKSGDGIMARPPPKRSKANSAKNISIDLTGSKSSLKGIPMMTISESDNWEISSCSGMKYGQYVDWEKIDPEAAVRYQQILASDHRELKYLGRSGFFAMPHTLRAKAHYHIIQGITGKSVTPDGDEYPCLARQLFGEHKMSTHPFPGFMEDGEIPRYCLNKAGLNSVKRVLLCISERFPDVTFCPILPALVSLLLHFSEDEAKCFHSVCCLVTYADPGKRYIDQTFLTYRASCMTFGDLANKYCRGSRKLIAASNQNLFEFYSDWIMWIFTDLPFPYAIRVLDVYLLEGYKVLYRVALALLSLYKVSVASRVAHVDDFRHDMKSFVQNVARHINTEGLLERAFRIHLPTRKELNFLFNANKDALIHKGIHEKRQSYQTMDFGQFSSSVVTELEMRIVWAWIPERFALFNPTRLFSTNEHGRSLTSFYSQVEGHVPTVLLLKTVDEEVCGAFLSSDWAERKKHDGEKLTFFGTGESFVFTLRPGKERYQRTVVHISGMLGKSHPAQERGPSRPSSSSSSADPSVTLTCPAGTLQDPRYLTIPFTSPAEGRLLTSMFMAGDDERLVIGGDGGHALYLQADLTRGRTERCDTFESPPLGRGRFKIQSLEVWGIQNSVSLPLPLPQ